MEISKNTVVYPGLKIGSIGIILGILALFSSFGDLGTGFFMAVFCIILALGLGAALSIVGQFLRVVVDPLIPDFLITSFWGAIGYRFLFRYGFPIIGGLLGAAAPAALIDPSFW